jgi:hypothetical protein
MKAKDKIFIQDWQNLKPYHSHSSTDLYYLSICNEILNELNFVRNKDIFISEKYFKDFVCFMVSYFEDVISQTYLFATFRKKHFELYGKKLPFYAIDEDDYFEDEINYEDIKFLIWYFANAHQDEKVLNAEYFVIDLMAADIYKIFDKHFETAPENELLKKEYYFEETIDYYETRAFIQKVLLGSYLFYPDINYRFTEDLNEVLEENKNDDHLEQYLKEFNDAFCNETHTKLLSLNAYQWTALLIGENHKNYESVLSIKNRIRGFFTLKETTSEHFIFEHVATKENINVVKKSIDYIINKSNSTSVFHFSLINFQGDYWFTGTCSFVDYKEEIIKKIEKDNFFKNEFKFLPKNEEKILKIIKQQYEFFLKKHSNKAFVVIKGNEVNAFCTNFISEFNKTINNIENFESDVEELLEINTFDETDEIIMYFNPKSGLEIAFNVSLAFPQSIPFNSNPNEHMEEIKDDFYTIMVQESISTELAWIAYQEIEKSIYLFIKDDFSFQNYDFLLRFYKTNEYFTKPRITLK